MKRQLKTYVCTGVEGNIASSVAIEQRGPSRSLRMMLVFPVRRLLPWDLLNVLIEIGHGKATCVPFFSSAYTLRRPWSICSFLFTISYLAACDGTLPPSKRCSRCSQPHLFAFLALDLFATSRIY